MTVDWESGVRAPLRLAAVERSGLVGIGPEDEFDRLIELAVKLTRVSRGLIALVDADHTTAMSSVGFPEGLVLTAPIELSFCRFVVSSGRPLIVEDANADGRTAGDQAIELYQAVSVASYPLEDPDGFVLGTFCVMDSKPHEWTATDLQVLATLAMAASTEIALRRAQAELEIRREI
jgi:GAF domain-containing protein